MKNTQELVDSLVPHKLEGDELDKINEALLAAADEMKEEVLPNINECIKCGELLPRGQEGTKCNYCLL